MLVQGGENNANKRKVLLEITLEMMPASGQSSVYVAIDPVFQEVCWFWSRSRPRSVLVLAKKWRGQAEAKKWWSRPGPGQEVVVVQLVAAVQGTSTKKLTSPKWPRSPTSP